MLVVGQKRDMLVPCEAYIFSVIDNQIGFCNNTTHKQIVIAEYKNNESAKLALEYMYKAYERGNRVYTMPQKDEVQAYEV